eukprot:jgi/Ulvmu1/7456/UM036_0118.1
MATARPAQHAQRRPQLFQAFVAPSAPPLADARAAQRFLAALQATPDRHGALWELVSGHRSGVQRLAEVLAIALPIVDDASPSSGDQLTKDLANLDVNDGIAGRQSSVITPGGSSQRQTGATAIAVAPVWRSPGYTQGSSCMAAKEDSGASASTARAARAARAAGPATEWSSSLKAASDASTSGRGECGGGAAGGGGGALLMQLLGAVCVEHMVQPARLRAEQSRALVTIYAQVYDHPGAMQAISEHTTAHGISTPVAAMLVLLAHSTQHAQHVLACPCALRTAAAAVQAVVQLEAETPAVICTLVATFADRLRAEARAGDVHADDAHMHTSALGDLLKSLDEVLDLAKRVAADGGDSAESEEDDAAGGMHGEGEGFRADLQKLMRTWPGKRHENDCRDYRKVELAPVWAELAPDAAAPFLPAADGGDMFLASEPVERGLDRAFRLLREDQVASMRARLAAADTPRSSTAPKPPQFQNACLVEVCVWRQGDRPYLHCEFDLPPRAFFQFKNNLKGFWERSPWLSVGSLVLLRPQHTRGHSTFEVNVILAEVIHRDADKLAGRGSVTGYAWSRTAGHNTWRQRCMIGVTPCTREDTLRGLSAYASFKALNRRFASKQAAGLRAGQSATFGDFLAKDVHSASGSPDDGSESPEPVLYELVEVSPDFSVSRAVLRSLQNVHTTGRQAERVRLDSLTSRTSMEFSSHVDTEEYSDVQCLPLGELLFTSLLADTASSSTVAATNRGQGAAAAAAARSVGTVARPDWQSDPAATQWLKAQLQRFDQAQTGAFNFALSSKVAMIQGPPGTHRASRTVVRRNLQLLHPVACGSHNRPWRPRSR